jgi:hypothetical protein
VIVRSDGLRVGRTKFDSWQRQKLVSIPQRLHLLWDSPNLISYGCKRHFTPGLGGRGVKLTAHLNIAQRLRHVFTV